METSEGSAASASLLLALGSAAVVTFSVCGGESGVPAAAVALTLATASSCSAALFAPGLRPHTALRESLLPLGPLAWALVVAGVAGAGAAIFAPPASGLAVAGLLLPMIVILQCLLGLGMPRELLFACLMLALAAPVWLGPLAELAGSQSGLPGWIVWLSPLTHLAAVAHCDYLHAGWFYSHSPLAGLQAERPAAALVIVCYFAAAAGFFGFNVKWSGGAAVRGPKFVNRSQEPFR